MEERARASRHRVGDYWRSCSEGAASLRRLSGRELSADRHSRSMAAFADGRWSYLVVAPLFP
jgi:hypothetical protein